MSGASDISTPSLDRFVRQRARGLLGVNPQAKGGMIAMGINAIVQGTLGITFTTMGFFVQNEPAFRVMGPIFVLAACGLAWGSFQFRKKLQGNAPELTSLTPAAKSLLFQLANTTGWWDSPLDTVGFGRHHSRWNIAAVPTGRSCGSMLKQEAAQMLESAAEAFQRVITATEMIKGSHEPDSLKGKVPSVILGALEGMCQALDAAAMINLNPHTADAAQKRGGQAVDSLRELADRIEVAVGSQQTTSAPQGSTLHRVLDDLRLDQLARTELEQTVSADETDAEQHVQGG